MLEASSASQTTDISHICFSQYIHWILNNVEKKMFIDFLFIFFKHIEIFEKKNLKFWKKMSTNFERKKENTAAIQIIV